jgi:hypothetical protein
LTPDGVSQSIRNALKLHESLAKKENRTRVKINSKTFRSSKIGQNRAGN